MRTQVAERRQSHSCTAVPLTDRADRFFQVCSALIGIVYKSVVSNGTIRSNAVQSGVG